MHGIYYLRKYSSTVKRLLIWGFFICLISQKSLVSPLVFAFTVGERTPITDENVPEGSIVCYSGNQYHLCNKAYDPNIVGVTVTTPSIVVGPKDNANLPGLVRSGEAYVRVSLKNGEPKKGDYITTSDEPGVGQVATQSGFVLGVVYDYTATDGNTGVAQVFAQLNPGPRMISGKGGSENLVSSFRLAMSAPNLSPLASLRYIIASFFSIIAFSVGFVYFGKTASVGVEAFGRNPLASKRIGIGMLLSFLLFMVITSIGLLIAYLILAL